MTDKLQSTDLRVPRTVAQIVGEACRLYLGWPRLFILLAAIVLIPYEVVTVLVTNTKHVRASTDLILALADIAIVNPFIAALQMQALLDLGAGRRPAIRDVIRRAVGVLAVVAAADIVAGISEFLGLIAFIVPGVLIAIRMAVAAPVAASEQVSWPDAVKRSFQLTQGNALRVLGLLLVQAVLTYLIAQIVAAGPVGVAVAGAVLAIIAQSFCTLLINLLYFDLRARESTRVAS